jgi:hypothetical protein
MITKMDKWAAKILHAEMSGNLTPSPTIDRCTPTRCCGECDTPGRRFYVSVTDGPRFTRLSGPYLTHQSALDAVGFVKIAAESIDARAVWYAFGTCSMEPADSEPLDGPVATAIRRIIEGVA